MLGKGQDWYGTQDPDAGHDAIDALIELNRKAAGSVPDHHPADARAVAAARREAADLLWDAFLADLDDAFGRRPAQSWGYGPLVLLNRADDGSGGLFLDELVKARARRKRAGLPPDPLLVVAASRGQLVEAQEEDVSSARIDDVLRGAYIALENADSQSSPLPVKIRLVLANVGSTEQGWQQVVSQLKALSATNGEGRLIAIAGMGISVTQTQQMASKLGDGGAGIPMFGAVTTRDTLDTTTNPDLYRVVPSVQQQIQAMIPYLEEKGEPLAAVKGKRPPIAIVEDANIDDLYKQSMKVDFQASFPNLPPDDTHPYSYTPLPNSFVDNQRDGLVGATGIPLWFTPQHDLAQPEIPIVEITGGQPPSVVAVIGAGTAKKNGGR